MQPNVKYTVLISTAVATGDGTALSENYTWNFTTGVLNLTIPPVQQPNPGQVGISSSTSISPTQLGESPLARERRVHIHNCCWK
jgi:hypothetical protein